jgi:hypothetical protein
VVNNPGGAIPTLPPTTAAGTVPQTNKPSANANRYSLLDMKVIQGDPFACMPVGFSSANREEIFSSSSGAWSPGTAGTVCGEVYTITFGRTSSQVLQAALTNYITPALAGTEGWAQVQMGGSTAVALPLVGFSATSAVNNATNGNLGMTLQHRWWE